ncbi:MAG: ABC transporter permease [Acidobacteria bacterium]|nr:ABC transporter permease [Acidobacteriota bacterium]
MLNSLISGLRSLFYKENQERELDAELRFHLECQIEENIRKGMNRTEAELAAKKTFGNITSVKEKCREIRGISLFEDLWQDICYGFKLLKKNYIYSLIVILTLALGIGANSAIFSVIYGVLLRPLPYEKSNDLIYLKQQAPLLQIDNIGFSVKDLEDYRKTNHSLIDIAEHHSMTFILLGREQAEQVRTSVVSANFFDLLGVKPLMGRTFLPDDEKHGAEAVLILSYNYWQKNHNKDKNIIGKVFQMNDRPHRVIGVLPSIPEYPVECDVYMPTSACPTRSSKNTIENRSARMVNLFGRLKSDITVKQANSEFKTIAANLEKEYPEAYPKNSGFTTSLTELHQELTEQARPTLLILLTTTGFVLLIACANVANLALARLMSREKEIAVRKALGASKSRLIRQLITESIILTTLAGLLGLVLASSGLHLLIDFASRFTSRASEIQLDSSVLIFTFVVSLVTGILFGLLPAFLPENSLMKALKDGSAANSAIRWQKLRGALLVAQVSFCFVLLIGAGLMIHSLVKLQQVSPGFNPENVLAIRIRPNWSKYTTTPDYHLLYQRILDKVKNQPGISSAALASTYPLDKISINFGPANQTFSIENHPTSTTEAIPQVDTRLVSTDYFQTIELLLVTGRVFADSDNLDSPKVAIINRSLAQHRWQTQDPIGKRLSLDDGKTWITIVGIVGNVKQYGLNKDYVDELYLPLMQYSGAGNLLVRTRIEPANLKRELQKALYELEPEMAIPEIETMQAVVSESMASPRLTTILLAIFASLALLITITGIVGVMALMVTQRKQEIAIRMALGATQHNILWLILRKGIFLVAIGLSIGVAVSVVLTRLMSSLLFAIEPTDPITFFTVSFLLIIFAILACFVPAHRASLTDPMKVLKE